MHQGYVQLRGVGRWMYASSAAYPTTPYPLRSAWPGTHPTPALGAGAAARLVWLHAGGRDGGAAFALAPLTGLPRPSALGAARRQPRPTPSPRRGGLAGVDEQALPAGEEEVSPPWAKMQSLVCAAGGNSPHHTSASSASPATAASTHPTPTLFKLPVACKVPYHPLPPRASVYIHLPTPRN